jgi:cytochrome P450
MKETERIYGPTIGLIAREALTDHRLGYLNVQKGTSSQIILGTYIQIGVVANNYNPQYFEAPETFNPDRWLKGPLDDPFTFLPFSAGARNCIGQHLANLMVKVVLIRSLTQFNVELDPTYNLVFDVTTQYGPVGPMKFTVTKK